MADYFASASSKIPESNGGGDQPSTVKLSKQGYSKMASNSSTASSKEASQQFEEVSLGPPLEAQGNGHEQGQQSDRSSVYRSCSVDTSQQQPAAQLQPEELHGLERRSASSWSLVSGWLFRCCRGSREENEEDPGIEMEDFYGVPRNVDQVDVLATTSTSSQGACSLGPTMTIDCSKGSFGINKELDRLHASVGDKLRKLLILNPPLKSAMSIFSEPLVTQNIFHLNLTNCDLTIKDLCSILASLKTLEQLNVQVKDIWGEGRSSLLQEDLYASKRNPNYFTDLCNQLVSSSGDTQVPSKLKVFTLSMPMTWQCGLVCRAVEVMSGTNHLEELSIKSSLKAMLYYYLADTPKHLEELENPSISQALIVLDARTFIQKHSDSLKHLTISCGDTFPLEHLQLTKTLDKKINMEELYKWSYFCTLGVLESFVDLNGKGHLILPKLTNLSIDLPMIPVTLLQDDDMRKPLNAVAEFLAKNNGIHVVTLCGLRPEKKMENWIQNSLVTIPKFKMAIGCTYKSTTLGANLTFFGDELQSLGLEITEDEERTRVTQIIEPDGAEVVPNTWKFSGMRTFHLVNQLPGLESYDLERIAGKFSKLTKLVIEDFTRSAGNGEGEGQNPFLTVGSLTDQDMQMIFQKLVMLEYLHLDCNMEQITDVGLTGFKDSLWNRVMAKDKLVSFWQLCNVKYVYMRGMGKLVTDRSAMHAFSEEYSLKKLQELHVFAPGFTNFGREKIRRAYAGRSGFILEL